MADLGGVLALARQSGPGFTSLPSNEKILADRLALSDASFQEKIPVRERWYTLILEQTDTGEVQGIASVRAAVGTCRPHYSFRIITQSQFSQSAEHFIDHELLMLVNECNSWSEVGSLFVKPEARSGGAGRLLSRSRYMLIASHQELFGETIMAELRGYFDEEGMSPFWSNVASKFFRLPFHDADGMITGTDGQFLHDLAPRYPIYVELLPQEARDRINMLHPMGEPAFALLEREGFRKTGLIDIFDAGPTLACRRDEIATVRYSTMRRVEACDDPAGTTDLLICNAELEHFRCARMEAAVDEDAVHLTSFAVDALGVSTGSDVRVCQ